MAAQDELEDAQRELDDAQHALSKWLTNTAMEEALGAEEYQGGVLARKARVENAKALLAEVRSRLLRWGRREAAWWVRNVLLIVVGIVLGLLADNLID